MFKIFVFLGLAGAGIYGAYHFHLLTKIPGLPKLTQSIPAPHLASTDLQGKVEGISTFANNASDYLFSSPSAKDQTVDVGSVANEISNKVEAIPSQLLDQAKIAYCQAVLREATKSASPKP